MTASGATFLEKTLKVTKPCYADYIARISAFFPWLPRKYKAGYPSRALWHPVLLTSEKETMNILKILQISTILVGHVVLFWPKI
jgi:hypothetical protein